MDKQQKKLEDFYGIAKDQNRTRDDYSNERRNEIASDKKEGNMLYPEVTYRKNTNLNENFRVGEKKTNSSGPSLDDCRTYALPCHIPRIWAIVKPKLTAIINNKVTDISKFLEIIREFIQTHYKTQLKNINIQLLARLIESLPLQEGIFFFGELLPFIAKLALEAESLFKDPLYILKQNNPSKVTLTKRQVACLVSHMFFCTLHKQNNEHLRFDCNFTSLYRDSKRNEVRFEKLKCIYNYFRRLFRDLPAENITFERLVYRPKVHGILDLKFWENSKNPLLKCIVKDNGSIEDEKNSIHVDFANRMIGGGLLESGCVQEEIRFLISPETFVSLIITESMLDHEAVMIIGAERYSNYSGYSDQFKYAGVYKDQTQLDDYKRKDTAILAIDAIDFSRASSAKVQFKMERILREVNKAFVGFSVSGIDNQQKKLVSTGRWGCGVFLGDSQLKLILQWIAASQAGRDMIFYRFNDDKLKDAERVIKKFESCTIGEIFEGLKSYNTLLFGNGQDMSLFDYLLHVF